LPCNQFGCVLFDHTYSTSGDDLHLYLIDTGSSVSTVSHSFYIDNFSDLPIHPIKELLRIECADGQELPYEGFIEVDLTILGSRGTHSKDSKLHNCLFLVVPDSNYNSAVPVLIGTNILSSL
jgi:hypothetical protein